MVIKLLALNNPLEMGPILGQPIILPHKGPASRTDLFVAALHAQGTDELRVQTFTVGAGGKITRKDPGPETGHIDGSPAAVNFADGFVTASHGKRSGRLKLIAWRVTKQGNVKRLSDSGDQIGPPGGIRADLADVGDDTVILAVKTVDGKLKVIKTFFNRGGFAIRGDGDAAGEINSDPSVAYAGFSRVQPDGLAGPVRKMAVTAVHSGAHRLLMIAWELQNLVVFEEDALIRRSQGLGPPIDGRPALTGGWYNEQIHNQPAVFAAINNNGQLTVQTWKVQGEGASIDIVSSEETGRPILGDPAAAFISFGKRKGNAKVATAVRLANSRLGLDIWTISKFGELIKDGHLSNHGALNLDITCSGSPSIAPALRHQVLPNSQFLVAVKTDGDLVSFSKWGLG